VEQQNPFSDTEADSIAEGNESRHPRRDEVGSYYYDDSTGYELFDPDAVDINDETKEDEESKQEERDSSDR